MEMLGLAAERNEDGTVTVVSPKDGIEFNVDETILSIHSINLGDFCRIGVKNNSPTSYRKDENSIPNSLVVVENSRALVAGVQGVLCEKLAQYYETEEFGEVACKDEKSATRGEKYALVISRLPESDRVGVFSRFVWGAVRAGHDPLKIKKLTKAEQDAILLVERSNAKSSDERKKRVVALVVSVSTTGQKAYAACNLTYPGKDINVLIPKTFKLKVGDWIEMKFTDKEFALYFPSSPTDKTKRAKVSGFQKLPAPDGYSAEAYHNRIDVKIDNFKLHSSYVQGSSIIERYLGEIAVGEVKIPPGATNLSIVMTRGTKNDPNGRKWQLKEAKEMPVVSDGSSEFTLDSSSEVSGPVTSQKGKKGQTSYGDFPPQTFGSYFGGPSPMPLNYPSMAPMVAPMFPPMMYPPPMAYFNAPPVVPIRSPSRSSVHEKPSKTPERNRLASRGSRTESVDHSDDEEEPKVKVLKRAVITSLKPNKSKFMKHKDTIAFLWLLEDHVSSVFYTSASEDIYVGLFFAGNFKGSGKKWNCEKIVKPVGKLMDHSTSNDSIEFRITVHQYFPPNSGNIFGETQHEFIGRIIDHHNKLPHDCSAGVKISVRSFFIVEKDQWCWTVHRIFQSKYIQMLREFYIAWQTPGIRDLVNKKCFTQYQTLHKLLDIPYASQLGSFYAQNAKIVAEQEEEKENMVYAWTTLKDKEFVRMTIFPRKESQKMSDLKKNVTDKAVYEDVASMEVDHLYRVELDEKGEVAKMFDCPQYISPDENGNFQFKFVCSRELLVTKNSAVVSAVGLPKSFGKLLFIWLGNTIPKEKYLMKAPFRLMDDEDIFAVHDLVQENGGCFMTVKGDVEMLENQDLTLIAEAEKLKIEKNENNGELDAFQKKLHNMQKDVIFLMYQDVSKLLKNAELVELLKKNNVFSDSMRNLVG